MLDNDFERRKTLLSALGEAFMRKPWLFPLAGLAIIAVCICLVAGLVLIMSDDSQLDGLRRQLAGRLATPTATPPCVEPGLTLGAMRFRIEPIQREADGSVAVPPDTPGVAYWVEGTSPNYVFALSPLGEYSALFSAIREGDPAIVQWADCGLEEFIVLTVESSPPDLERIYDQSRGGITVFAMGEPGVFIHSGRPELAGEATLTPEVEGYQMEVDFLDTVTSEDGRTITTGITIHNTGTEPISLTPGDLSLTEEGGQPQAPIQVEPVLPAEIQPGGESTFYITFLKPPSSPAIFRILDVTIDLYH